MLASNIPIKFPIPFANGAGAGFVRPIPLASQIGVNPGFASLTDGFPPLNFTPQGSGGIPPFGQDVNGLMLQITQWIQWISAGAPVPYDAAFQTAIGGYPKGAIVGSATNFGTYWLNLADSNTTNPDTGGTNWKSFVPGMANDYYADVGSVNALAITTKPATLAYTDGLTFLISPAHATTAAATLAVNGLAAKAIVHTDGTALLPGEIQTGALIRVAYVGSSFQWLNPSYCPTRPLNDNSTYPASTAYADRAATVAAATLDFYHGAIYGLTTSNTPAATTTSVSVSVGACRDSTNIVAINLAAPIAKLLTAVWAAGTGNGGRLEATALAAGQTWFMHLIYDLTHTVVDVGFSQSPTAPPLPTNYSYFRRIGSIVLEPTTTNIKQFIQIGDWFLFQIRSADYAATANGGLIAYYRPVTVPIGIVTEALFVLQSTGTVDGNVYFSGVFNPAFGVPPAFGVNTQWAHIRRGSFYQYPGSFACYGYILCTQYVDSTGHIYTRSSDNLDTLALGVLGYRDDRGKFY